MDVLKQDIAKINVYFPTNYLNIDYTYDYILFT